MDRTRHAKRGARGAAVALVVVVCVAAASQAQRAGQSFYSGSGSTPSRALSPSVVSVLWSHDEDHAPVLEFLVLFRGSPGWFVSAGPGTAGYNFNESNGHATNHAFATGGAVTVSIDSDSSVPTKKLTVMSKLTTILDRQFAPGEVNVVLVDRVDDSAEPPIVELRYMEPRLAGDGEAVVRALRASPDLLGFLRCDAGLPDALPGIPDLAIRALRTMPPGICNQLR